MTKRMRLSTAKKAGFSKKVLRTKKELPRQAIGYLKHKSSFLVAAFSLVAFISGNMMGQHGWYAFWKAALGQYDDSLITYTGTVTPVQLVPDYAKWNTYGGNGEEHTFRQVPKDILVPLPTYSQSEQKKDYDHSEATDVYSMGFMGSYDTGAEGDGSHVGIDIRMPIGTPIRSIANGIVTSVREDANGFGKLVVIRHPHMPDPENPQYSTVLYSVYAHLSAQQVSEGEVVQKGQEIALSGKTGFVTGPHLHFQIDRDEAPWHPYWAFSYTEAKEAGMNTIEAINAGFRQDVGYKYSVNPMLLIQANYPAPKYKTTPNGTVVKKPTTVARASSSKATKNLAAARDRRLAERLARNATLVVVAPEPVRPAAAASSSSKPTIVVDSNTLAAGQGATPSSEAPVIVSTPVSTSEVASVSIEHDRYFTGRAWENVRLTLLDVSGNPTTEGSLKKDVYLRLAYGEAEFDPPRLSAKDFKNGVATIKMLPIGRRTVVIQIEPFKSMSKPMEYQE